jgi:1,4-alpha-glucan branching enzyme
MTKKWALGAVVHSGGVHFGVWAPFADSVSVNGDFNGWDTSKAVAMTKADDGTWSADVDEARPGQEYQYILKHDGRELFRNDPRALQLTASGDKSVIVDPTFDWEGDDFTLPDAQKLLVYEMHVGTFNRPEPETPGTFDDAIEKLDYVAQLGVNAIEVLPVNAVWDDRWWGYTPINLYAVDAAYGGFHAFLRFVRAAHKKGIGVIADVIYNHMGTDPGMNLWQFDGWSKDGKGGIYFYNDRRSDTPWGARFDYGRPEVREFLTDNARLLMRDCHLDGLRLDATVVIRKEVLDGSMFNEKPADIPEGWQLLQDITSVVKETKPRTMAVAEDLQGNEWITKPREADGAGFTAQWENTFGYRMRDVLDPSKDESRSMEMIRFILNGQYNNDPFERVIYTESHDADANGRARLDEEIAPGDGTSWAARKRSTLGAGVLLTSPGVPMLFQGQEFMETGAFTHWQALDWEKTQKYEGVLTLYRHLIKLRQNAYDNSRGLIGPHINVFLVDDGKKLVAYHRWYRGGAGDDVVVVVNFANSKREGEEITFPQTGLWRTRFNSDWKGYGEDFSDVTCPDVTTEGESKKGTITIGPYSLVILSQDPES